MHFKVSKYDPALKTERLAGGREWTSVNDVGRRFSGRQLSVNDYLAVERTYIAFGLAMAALQKGPLVVLELEGNARDWAAAKRHALTNGLDSLVTPKLPKQGDQVAVQGFADLLRACLREQVWARVSLGDACQLACGYDYYLYLWGNGVKSNAKAAALALGLFVESQQSPWADA